MEVTQEIYDYLWIRQSLILEDHSKLTKCLNKRENFKRYIKCVSNLLKRENLLIVYDGLEKYVSDTINAHRFEFNDKEINIDLNYIIGRCNDFRAMPEDERKKLARTFMDEEIKDRGLPNIYKHYENDVSQMMIQDLDNMEEMFITARDDYNINVVFEGEDDDNSYLAYESQKEGETPEKWEPYLLSYTSFINLIMNRFPEYFEQNGYIEIALMQYLKLFNKEKMDFRTGRYVTKAFNKLVKLKEKQLDEENVKVLEKTNN